MNNEISGKTLLSVTASIAATIIPDTPIVSIAGATLSEITTTTTSTTTTPTPTPTPSSFIPSNKTNKDHNNANLPNNPMSDAAVAKSAGGNGTAAANNTTSNTPADTGGITGKEHTTIVNIANAGKTDDATTNTDTKKSDVSDLEEPELKKLLDEAYNYKTPKDKKDKSEIFLDLLQKVENEDLGITSTRSDSHRHHPHSQNRHQQKQGGSLQDLLQLPSDFRRQNHTSRHKKNSSVSSRQREGGSLPSNVNVANCLLSSFGQQSSVYTDKRVRRGILPGVESATVALNSNKTLVGVVGLAVGDPNANCLLSTFEQQTPGYADKPVRRGLVGGDPNATTGCTGTGTGSGSTNSAGVCSKDSGNSVGASVTSVIGGAANMATTASGHSVGGTMATGAGIVNSAVKTANSSGSSDYIINIDDMIDIQQQQQILPSKAQDGRQGLSYYERVDIDMRIPRPNLNRGEGGDFAPAHSHHYVDEVIRFQQIDGGDGSLCESGEVAISVNNIGNKHKSAAASCSLPMPLDERYQSIKSVMGEKGDSVGATLNPAVTAKAAGTITTNSGGSINNTNNNAGAGVGTNSIGIGSYTKSLPMSRQTDENGNDCERQQHNSSSGSITVSAGQSQAKAKAKKKPQKDNTIPVDVENEAGYRGKDPVEVLLKFIEEDGKQGGGGGGNKFAENNKKKERKKEKVKQNKMKKSNSLEELRSCAKIDVGELKRSAATTESNNVTMRSKGSGGGKGGKNNSASTADINKNFDGGSKEGATSSPTTGGKQATAVATTANAMANNRKGERRSWGTEELQYLGTEGSVGGVGSNSGSVCSSSEDKAKEKKDKKSKDKDKEKEKDKERDVEKDKGKDKEKDKEKEKDSDRHDKLTNNKIDGNSKLEKHDRNDKVEKADRQEKIEKPERADKLEKRKKSESIMHTPIAHPVDRQDAGTPIFSAIDLLSMNTLISETAEFHVVTKKKKPKKQRASIDDTHFTQNSNYNNSNNNSGHNSYNNNNSGTTGGFSRAHNMVLNPQKNNNNNNNNNVSQQQQQQQQQSRYKYHNNNAHGFNSYGNGGSGGNSNSFGEDGRLDYRNNYNSNYNNNYNSNHSHQQYGYQHQQQQQAPYHHHQHHQQQQQQQQHPHNVNAHNMNSGSTDKSRRKSTSSVPPSEKSDSSDLDSVHSLPIESTTSSSTKNKQRHKQSDTSVTATPETPKSTAGGGSPGSAPISYAHIAAAAAADRWPSLDAANNNSALANGINTSPAIANNTSEQLQPQVANNSAEIATPASITNANNNPSTAAAVVAATVNSASKQSKSKKLTIKPDFPELGCSNVAIATAPDNSKPNIAPAVVPAVAAAPKTISYSQSLVAAPAQLITASNIAGVASGEKVAGPIVEPAVLPTAATAATAATSADRNTIPDANKVDANSGSARLSQHQPMPHQQSQQQTQPLQKSKSVEHDSYSFNSTNLDQQYPALEKTVKRHSATNVSISPPSAAVPLVGGAVGSSGVPTQAISSTTATNAANSTKFNFAAAAKQIAVKSSPLSQPILTQEPALAAAAATTQPSGVAATTTSATSAAYPAVPTNSTATVAGNVVATVPVTMPVRKSKEKSPTTIFAPTTAINALATAAVVPIATANLAAQTPDASAAVITARKSKKEKSQPVLSTEPAIGLTPTLEPHAHVAQKSSTATQTQASSMDIVTSGKTSRSQSSFDAGSESVVMPPISSKPQRQPASNANNSGKIHVAPAAITPTSIASAGAAVGTLSCNASSSRPAVIIMNDDRGGEGSAVGIEFTFGDFNEDELKFFDDNPAEDECPDEFAADETAIQQQTQQAPAATLHTGVANQQASAYPKSAVVPIELVNDNTATAYVENAALYAAVRASSPKPTFMGPPLSNVPVAKDIVHIVKTPSTAVANVVNNTVEHVNVNDTGSVVAASATDTDLQIQLQLQQQQQLQRRNSETQKLQQLETCNDIETAIIAAARAAAEQQHQQPMQPPPPQQQRSYRHKHQQQYRSTSYGNAYEPPQQREQRSQSAYTRDTSNNYQQQQQQHHYHSQYHQQQQHYHYHQSSSSNSASRSRSSSSNNNNANAYGDVTGSTPPPQSPNATAAVVVNIQRKEFDIHFIPPTVSNAYNALQHNEIIVDFIGSAWEEVAKVTKFYEGQ